MPSLSLYGLGKVKRKYDMCVTGPQADVSPDGRAVMEHLFQTLGKLAPVLVACSPLYLLAGFKGG